MFNLVNQQQNMGINLFKMVQGELSKRVLKSSISFSAGGLCPPGPRGGLSGSLHPRPNLLFSLSNLLFISLMKTLTLKPGFVMGLLPRPLIWMKTHYLLQNIRTGRNVVPVHLFELLGSLERKWGVAGVWKMYPVELQDRARLHFPYTTYYHVESVLQKRLKRQDHPLLIVSISIYNTVISSLSVATIRMEKLWGE